MLIALWGYITILIGLHPRSTENKTPPCRKEFPRGNYHCPFGSRGEVRPLLGRSWEIAPGQSCSLSLSLSLAAAFRALERLRCQCTRETPLLFDLAPRRARYSFRTFKRRKADPLLTRARHCLSLQRLSLSL